MAARQRKPTAPTTEMAARQRNDRLRSAGKSTKAAGGALAAKLAHICWAIMTSNQPWLREIAEKATLKSKAMASSNPN